MFNRNSSICLNKYSFRIWYLISLIVEQSRRDDMESLAYILFYFAKGSLPWQGIKAKNLKEKYDKIMEIKISTSINIMGKDCPEEFELFLNYVRELKFDEKPDYSFLKELLRNVAQKEKIFYDFYNYDWVTLKNINDVVLILNFRKTKRILK